MATTALALNAATDELRDQLERRGEEFAKALAGTIPTEHFIRVVMTAVAQNPKLLEADRRSLINACTRCAQDGLRPDGREAVLVIYKSKERGPVVGYQQMVAGIRRLVQQSGEITRFEQTIVYAGDTFEYVLGDHPNIMHRPTLADRGEPLVVYSVAQWRDGTLSREIMTTPEIEKVRERSRSPNEGPWVTDWGEMARKTVARRHAKVLPMSTDAADKLAADDNEHYRPLAAAALPALPSPRRPRLAERLDSIGPAQQPPETGGTARRRGRHRDDTTEADQVPDGTGDALPPGDDQPQADLLGNADYQAGVKDALRGATACLNHEISDDPRRFADWLRGFESQKRTP